MFINYKNKYLKYKTKYFSLKEKTLKNHQTGAGFKPYGVVKKCTCLTSLSQPSVIVSDYVPRPIEENQLADEDKWFGDELEQQQAMR